MKLYYLPGACSLASHIALYEAGLKFEAIPVDRKNRKTPSGEDFDAINPKGYVPALRLDSGEVLTENVAVLQYIADRNPSAKLAPANGTMERYRLIEWLAFINSEMHKSFGPLFNPAATEDMKRFARGNIEKRTKWLHEALGSRNYLLGDAFTVADAYLYTILTWFSRSGLDLAQWPNVKRYFEGIGARAHVIAARKAEGLQK